MKDYYQITVAGFEFMSILECNIHKAVGEHGKAYLKGQILETDVEKYMQYGSGYTWSSIQITDESDTKTAFAGILTDIGVEMQDGVAILSIELTGGTCVLDYKPKTRTFQTSMTDLKTIVNELMQDYEKTLPIFNIAGGTDEGELLVQYMETDYEFIKRVASHFAAPIITQYDEPGIKYHIGLGSTGDTATVETKLYTMKKAVDEYIYKKYHELEQCAVKDVMEYHFESRESYELGSAVHFNGNALFVYQVDSTLNGAELWHQYILRGKSGFQVEKSYNYNLIGASLIGKVEEIEKDKVKISCEVDGYQLKAPKKFLFSTVYSTGDGTGWYCMPEKEDRIRLFFPTEQEADAYVISAVHLETSSDERKDPDKKSIMNKYKKQIEFSKDKIMITNNDGLLIELDDKEGILIQSNKDITMEAKKDFQISSKNTKIEVTAPKGIKLEQGGTQIDINQEVKIKGTGVRIQP